MRLSREERIEVILMAGSGSSRKVAMEFNRKHVERTSYTTLWQNLLESSKKLEVLQINRKMVEDVQPQMKVQRTGY